MAFPTLAVDEAVRALRPDFVVLALRVPASATARARPSRNLAGRRRGGGPRRRQRGAAPRVAWRDAYRAFGAKPQRTPSSVEALWQRALKGGLPRVNWLVDLYNAVSVRHGLPVGGEDAAGFVGPLRLIRAAGHEPFDTVREGAAVVEYPTAGEVVWADDRGVTCRRWNWRQGTRTRLTEHSTDAIFLFERLEPLSLSALDAAGDALTTAILSRCPEAVVEREYLPAPESR